MKNPTMKFLVLESWHQGCDNAEGIVIADFLSMDDALAFARNKTESEGTFYAHREEENEPFFYRRFWNGDEPSDRTMGEDWLSYAVVPEDRLDYVAIKQGFVIDMTPDNKNMEMSYRFFKWCHAMVGKPCEDISFTKFIQLSGLDRIDFGDGLSYRFGDLPTKDNIIPFLKHLYMEQDNCMFDMLFGVGVDEIPCDLLSVEDVFKIYVELRKWADSDRFLCIRDENDVEEL